MKQRSLWKIYLFNILTIGLYSLYWLADTRKEMIKRSDVQVPSAVYLVSLRFAGLFAIVVIIACVFSFGRGPEPPRPSPDCFISYSTFQDAGSDTVTLDPACKKSINTYFDAGNSDTPKVALVIISTGVLAVSSAFELAWLGKYVKAVRSVTGGISFTDFWLLFLLNYSMGYGMVAIQHIFNELPKVSQNSVLPKIERASIL